jgi:hypothetical protein
MKPLLLLLTGAAGLAAAESITCPASADTWVAMHRWEGPPPLRADAEKNHGKDAELRIQGRVSFALLAFDLSGAAGMSVEKATLRIHRAPAQHPLHTVGLSTISGNGAWEEGTINFFHPAEGKAWSYAGSDLVDVTFAQGGSLYAYERARDAGGGWWEINVPPALVSALLAGDQYGLMLCDEKGEILMPHVLSSRESAHPPVLTVEGSRTDKTAPGAPRAFKTGQGIIDSSPAEARKLGRTTLRPGSVVLEFGGAGDNGGSGVATAYELRYSTRPIGRDNFDEAAGAPRWSMNPLAPKSGQFAIANALHDRVSAVVEGLKPGAVYYFAARARDEAGNRGAVAPLGRHRAYSRVFPNLQAAAAAAPDGKKAAGAEAGLRLWALPELLKIDPKTGGLIEADNFPDHRARNTVWDAAASTVRLTGARNEFLGFQIAIESGTPVSGIEVAIAKPLFAGEKLPPVFQKTGAMQLYREWFVPDERNGEAGPRGWYADALLPVNGALDLPAKDNAVPGQTVQPVFVDVYVPRDAAPGKHTGQITVRAAGRERAITVEVEVLPLRLPDELNFIVDLNCYSKVPAEPGVLPGTPAYRKQEQAYHRVAHLHRTNLDVLGNSHDGTTVPDHTTPLTGEGAATKVQSWADWDAHFGPLLDGSEFAALPRASVPIPAMYLVFFENWPGDLRRGYKWDDPTVPTTTEEYQRLIARHAFTAGPVQEGFSREYQERYMAVMAQFAEHFRQKGWRRTKFLVYFNDKYYYKRPEQGGKGISWWLFDEPNHRDSVLATTFFGWMTRRALAPYADVPILFRTDISRPEWMRDLMTGMVDLNCISPRFIQKNRMLQDDRNRFGRAYWMYGSSNHPRETNVGLRAWCWRVWLNGGDGLLPWLAVSGPRAWERAEPLTVFYAGSRFGQMEPFASLRLKAYRRGQQDMEYLMLLAQKKGWDRDAVTQAIANRLDLSGEGRMEAPDDAGTVSFQKVKDAEMDTLRLRVARTLAER